MIDLEMLQEKWTQQDRKLDESLQLNRRILMMSVTREVRSPLRRFVFFQGVAAAAGLAMLMAMGQFMYQHWMEPRFLVPAVILDVWVVVNVAVAIRQAVVAEQIEFDQPVTGIQKQLESLRIIRLRAFRWDLLTGQLVWWIPFLIVALQGAWGIDAYQIFGRNFLALNFLLGVAVIPVAIWASRKYGDRLGRSWLMRRVAEEIAGRDLRVAMDSLAKISEFDRE